MVTCLSKEKPKHGRGMVDGRSFSKGVKQEADSARVKIWHQTWPVSNWLAGRSQLHHLMHMDSDSGLHCESGVPSP